MTKKEYLKALKRSLSRLKRADRNSLLDFYKEIIDDKTENGKTEEEAISELEPAETVAQRTLSEYGFDSKDTANRKFSGKTIAILIVSSPLLLALFIAAAAIGLAGIGLIVGILAACVAICLGLTVGGTISFAYGIVSLFTDLGFGLIAVGVSLIACALGALASPAFYKLIVFSVDKIKSKIKGERI